MLGFIHSPEGDVSAIRVALLFSLILGGSVIIAGLVGWFVGLHDAVLMVGAGSGLISALGLGKSWQAQAEYKGGGP